MHVDIKKVCTATDFSEAAHQAVEYGAALAKQFGAEFHLLHVLDDARAKVTHPDFMAHGETARAWFNRLEQEAVERGEAEPRPESESEVVHQFLRGLQEGVDRQFDNLQQDQWWREVESNLVRAMRYGHPVDQICRYADKQQIDLLVLGTQGRSGLKHLLLGSVAERVVRSAPCPTLVVREKERDFVVED